ncbi:M48 family metallopeptidase [Candidatus Rhodobacter oscarellae]|nr:M48 family metallopeptidase [Candidatus Rhodobacter lobularis]
MRPFFVICAGLALAACTTVTSPPATAPAPGNASNAAPINSFSAVVARVEPVAEQVCRERAPRLNCDFEIFVDRRAGLPANAFQTVDRNGRPIIGFTASLVAELRNRDELAFILGHEAAHHIAGHLSRQRDTALRGALVAGILAGIGGGNAGDVRSAQEVGATVGARVYSKEFELEADALGTVIAYRAGFNPSIGALFFTRIADPGNQFLGTHPPNAQRIQTVQRTLETLR